MNIPDGPLFALSIYVVVFFIVFLIFWKNISIKLLMSIKLLRKKMSIKLIAKPVALIASIAGAVATVHWTVSKPMLSGFLILISVVVVWIVISSGMHKVMKVICIVVPLIFLGLVAMLFLFGTY